MTAARIAPALLSGLAAVGAPLLPGCQQQSAARRARAASHNARAGTRAASLAPGGCALWGALARGRDRKIDAGRRGPRRAAQCLPSYPLAAEDLLAGARQSMHGARLRLPRGRGLEQAEELRDQLLLHQANELSVASGFTGARRRAGAFEALALWRGLEDAEAAWEPLLIMREDALGLLSDYLRNVKREGAARSAAVPSRLASQQPQSIFTGAIK